MKKLALLIAMLILCPFQPSFAAFPVKQCNATATHVANARTGNFNSVKCEDRRPSSRFSNLIEAIHSRIDILNPVRKRNDTVGILSLICGIIGIIPVYGLGASAAAIVLGAIGMRHDERYSVAGFVLGIVMIAITVLGFALLIMALG